MHVIMYWMSWRWNGILFPKLFWPFVRKNWQKLMKFETEGREFAKGEGGVCWKILLWFRNLQEKLENEDPGSRSWGHWSKTRWKKVSAKNCHMYLWNKYINKTMVPHKIFDKDLHYISTQLPKASTLRSH